MTTTDTTKYVRPITCSRCKGKGYVNSAVVYAAAPGGCFKCDGEGVVEGDKATLAEAKAQAARRRAARERVHLGDHGHGEVDASWDATKRLQVRAERSMATYGLSVLEVNEPERFGRAVDAILAGRMDVYPALVAYGRAHPAS